MAAPSAEFVRSNSSSRRDERREGGFSLEFELLCACLSWPLNEARLSAVAARASGGIDWSLFIALMERHRVAGLVANALSKAKAALPPDVRAGLAERARSVALEELGMALEVGRLTRALQAAKVRPVVLKGVSLAIQAYGRLGLRQNRDIDLLVSPEAAPQALRRLTQLGYEPFEPPDALDPNAFQDWSKRHKDVALRRGPAGPLVELHWRLFDTARPTSGLEEARTVALTLPGAGDITCLHPQSALIYMCEHGAEHAWSRLKWLADLNALISQLAPEEVAGAYQLARRSGRWSAMASGLHLAATLLLGSESSTVRPDAGRWQTRGLSWMATKALAITEREEFEGHPYGSTMKTASRYLLSGDLAFLGRQFIWDLNEVPKSYSSARLQRLGVFAKAPLWVYRRWRAAAGRSRSRGRA